MYKVNYYYSNPKSFFSNSEPRETVGVIGHLRGDFGKNGNEFWTTWFDRNSKLNTPEFKEEIDSVINELRETILKDRKSMNTAARLYPSCRIDSDIGEMYGIFVETDSYEYSIRMNVDAGTYDFYCYCADKRFQPSQYRNAKRFRDENGQFTLSIEEIAKKTMPEANNYYIDGDRYENDRKVYTFRKQDDNMFFEGAYGKKHNVDANKLGTYLPDVASAETSFSKLPLDQTLTHLTLGDLLQSVTLDSVHLTHDTEDIDLATIEDFGKDTLTDEGKAAWKDVLNAEVKRIYEGAYGLQIECGNIDAHRLTDFSYMLSGNWSAEEYDKWVNSGSEPEQNMNM